MKFKAAIFMLWSTITFPIFASNLENEIFMFIGNPGVGKSTIINSLIGNNVANAGVSFGTGLTQYFSKFEHNGKSYYDTPGLEDLQMRQQAASEIEKALKQNGKYHLFFVITLEAGRIKPADITTIELVMQAISNENKVFNILINKLGKKEKTALFNNPGEIDKVKSQLNLGKFTTNSVRYLDFDNEINDGVKEFISIDNELKQFIFEKSLSISIADKEVEKIQTHQFEKVLQQHEQQMSDLKKALEEEKNKPRQIVHHHHYHDDSTSCVLQ